jgi:hypothetical protein
MCPLAFDPTETFPASLASDAGKPEAERPAFRFQHLSSKGYRERRKLQEEWDAFYEERAKRQADYEARAAQAGADVSALAREHLEALNAMAPAYEKLLDRTYAALAEKCVGWENIPAAFGSRTLDEVLNDAEARELLGAACRMNRLQVAEKKDSGSPSSGEPVSAAPADAAPDAMDSRPRTGSPLTAPPAADATANAGSAAGKTDS